MNDQITRINDAEEDESHVSTPIASQQRTSTSDDIDRLDNDTETLHSYSTTTAPVSEGDIPYSGEDRGDEVLDEEPRTVVLPVPTSSAGNQPTDALAEGYPPTMTVSLDSLPLEAATAPITVGAESRFVETSSATTARELKRLYDQHIGAGKDASIRSPFVITAFTSQHGKQMYRVGRRDMDKAPHGNADDLDIGVPRVQSTSVENSRPSRAHSSATNGTNARRRSRVSVASFFKNGHAHHGPKPVPPQDGTRSPPTRKLRRTRSIPNMVTAPAVDATASPATPTHTTGRPHAHSVSSVDAFRPTSLPPPPVEPIVKSPRPDYLASVLSWNTVPSSPLSSGSGLRSVQSLHSGSDVNGDDHLADTIRYPFGRGIAFDSPVRPSPSHLNSSPVLREMQSFESGLTARADPSSRTIRLSSLRTRPSNESVNVSDNGSNRGEEPSREESTIHLMPSAEHLQNTAMYTRYSTELFEVIQNYKGIPIFDKVADIPDPPTIKLSLKADGDPAVPRDDPRFVIWGEVEGDELDDNSASRSNTDIASVHSSLSRQRSTRDRASSAMAERPSIRTPSTERPKRVLVAATIERWIAQLTSELNYDELLIFFLTYRSYISALDLGHLLICRFHWALAEPRSPQDDHVRRIVRARTFIAIRYWLLTFFSCDFVPNRDLRLLFGNWLNNLHKDPILQRHKDAPGIVRKLRKVAKDCKDGYTRGQHKKSTTEKSDILPSTSIDFSQGDFAKNLRKAVGKGDEDDDIDLDFIGVPATGVQFGPNLNASSSGNAAIDLAMMAQPLHLTYLQMGKQTAIATTADVLPAQLPLPVPHNAISRVVVNAIGRLGRWKRVLNYRALNTRGAPVRPSLGGTCLDTSNFDLEASETGDLLLEAGGVEKYLKMLENQRKPGSGTALIPSLPAPSPLGQGLTNVPGSLISTATSNTAHTSLEPLTETSDEGGSTDEGHRQSLDPPSSRTSVASESVRFRHSISGSESTAIAPMDVVSIDDLDLSDLSSEDLHAPPPQSGLRKMGRRLPNRRDFELVRRSVDSVSSMGIHSAHARDSVLSTGSSAASSGPDMPGPIQDWQMNALVDSLSDDDEPGDVEAALKRLEGQINRDKQKHKQTKVDEWVKSINRTRHVRGGLNAGLRQYYSSDEEDYGEVQNSLRDNGAGQPSDSYASSRSSVSSVVSPTSAATHEEVLTPASPPGLNHTPNGSNDATAAQDQDTETLSPRPSRPTSSFVTSDRPVSLGMPSLAPSMGSGAFVRPEKSLKKHRSFVLAYKSEAIVQHFSVIDRDLFVHLKFEELVSPEWMASTEEYNVLDWSAYVKERHIMKTEQQIVVPPLTVIRNRFNITVNFVISEIILTHPSERVMVYSKFVRIAWKAYTLKNYHLLVATIAGLDSSWVQRALKQTRAKKRPIWESRVHHDLRQWCTSQDDFKHIRAAVEALVEAKSRAVGSPEPSQQDTSEPQSATSRARAASEGKPPTPPSCVPFFGIYLSELHRFNSLPDLIDPTAPQEPVDMDPGTGAFELAHPEVFSYLAPLPSTMQLEPLINVHKQRLVAGVVKSFVNGQHLAIKVDHMVEKKLYQKCMHLRGLEPETLQRVLALYSKWES